MPGVVGLSASVLVEFHGHSNRRGTYELLHGKAASPKYLFGFPDWIRPILGLGSTSVIYTAESDIQLRSKYLSETNLSENIIPNSDPMKWPGFYF